jgi:hypothetical protein
MTRPSEWHGDNMTGTARRETPQVGIFWLMQTTEGETRLLTAGCPLGQAEPYGDCLTYGSGHYETWAHWRRDRTVDPALRAVERSSEYEDWPRGRIVFDRARDLFILNSIRLAYIRESGDAISGGFVAGVPEYSSNWAVRPCFGNQSPLAGDRASRIRPFFCAEVQVKQLRAEGAGKVFREAASGVVTSLAFMVGHNFQAMMEREKSSRTVNR